MIENSFLIVNNYLNWIIWMIEWLYHRICIIDTVGKTEELSTDENIYYHLICLNDGGIVALYLGENTAAKHLGLGDFSICFNAVTNYFFLLGCTFLQCKLMSPA
jgi:hypothetical protein